MAELIGTGNYHSMAIDAIGKPKTIDSDGPVGFTPFMGDPSVYGTCTYASGCLLGATYNVELAKEMGEMIGNEGIIGNIAGDGTPYSGWYAPPSTYTAARSAAETGNIIPKTATFGHNGGKRHSGCAEQGRLYLHKALCAQRPGNQPQWRAYLGK